MEEIMEEIMEGMMPQPPDSMIPSTFPPMDYSKIIMIEAGKRSGKPMHWWDENFCLGYSFLSCLGDVRK
jgi:hypothetical protein